MSGTSRSMLCGLAMLGLALSACASPPPLRVGTSADYPPLTFVRDGEPDGLEVEFAERLEKELGRPVELVRLPFDELIPALSGRRIELIMSGMSITPERAASVRFCTPYQRVGQMALIRAADYDRLSPPAAMNQPSSKVGVMRATTGERFARSDLTRARLVSYPTIEPGVAALRAGQIDYFVHDAPTVWRIVGGIESSERQLTGLYRPLTDERLAWGVRPDNEALGRELDAIVERWKREGFLEDALSRWIPVRKLEIEDDGAP
jgi:ABC-type amino acid transport substrate-binding protein